MKATDCQGSCSHPQKSESREDRKPRQNDSIDGIVHYWLFQASLLSTRHLETQIHHRALQDALMFVYMSEGGN